MILRIRKQLLESDQNECFMTLFKYPHIDKISELVIFSNKLQQAIEDKVSGRRSAFLEDVLGIVNVSNNSNNKNNVNNNMSFAGMENYNNNANINNNNANENKNFFKNAMGSMGELFSSIKDKFNFKGNNTNSGENKGEIYSFNVSDQLIQGVIPFQSLTDSAKRLSDLYYKYHSMMSQNEDKEILDIIQYLKNYKG